MQSPKDFAKADYVLKLIKVVFNFGAVGNGKLVKAMINLLGAVNMEALVVLYRKLAGRGLGIQQLQNLMHLVQAFNNLKTLIENRHCPASFKLHLIRKDMEIGLNKIRGQFSPCSTLPTDFTRTLRPTTKNIGHREGHPSLA